VDRIAGQDIERKRWVHLIALLLFFAILAENAWQLPRRQRHARLHFLRFAENVAFGCVTGNTDEPMLAPAGTHDETASNLAASFRILAVILAFLVARGGARHDQNSGTCAVQSACLKLSEHMKLSRIVVLAVPTSSPLGERVTERSGGRVRGISAVGNFPVGEAMAIPRYGQALAAAL